MLVNRVNCRPAAASRSAAFQRGSSISKPASRVQLRATAEKTETKKKSKKGEQARDTAFGMPMSQWGDQQQQAGQREKGSKSVLFAAAANEEEVSVPFFSAPRPPP